MPLQLSNILATMIVGFLAPSFGELARIQKPVHDHLNMKLNPATKPPALTVTMNKWWHGRHPNNLLNHDRRVSTSKEEMTLSFAGAS